MRILVNGVEYGDFLSANVIVRLDALSNTFAFSSVSPRGVRPMPIKGGEFCQIIVDNEVVVTGWIEVVDGRGDNSGNSLNFTGRDKTGDILDSTIGPNFPDLKPPISLKAMVERVIAHIKATQRNRPDVPGGGIEVVDNVNPELFKAAEDLVSPEPGAGAFEFLEPYARKRQVLLTSDANGNFVIDSPIAVEIGAFIQNKLEDPGGRNNVLNYDWSYDSTGRFNEYRSISQLNTSSGSLAGILDAATVSSQGEKDIVTDRQIRAGRQLILISEASAATAQATPRAEWEANIRKARGNVYSATVSGFRNQTGDLWRVNTLLSVDDDEADIAATMLTNTVSYSLDEDSGDTTTIGFVNRNAFTLELEDPTVDDIGEEVSLFSL